MDAGDSTAGDSSDLTGRTLQSRYRILSEMGRGGMGAVYLADDQRLERRVVVKVPHAQMMEKEATRKRFFTEIEQMSHHEHPHIVRIQDFGEHEGRPYAVLQYVDGGNLADRLDRRTGPESVAQILEWLPDVADALDTVHARGAVHRDVKPANILFDSRGAAFLSDFGISTVMIGVDDATLMPDQHLTTTGAFIGSAPFAPPEAVERLLTPAYDQYSLGVVVYEALSRSMPFQAQTAELLLIAKHTEEPVPLDASGAKIPRSCNRAVMRALSRNPADRFESCGAFAEAFAEGSELRPSRSRAGGWIAAIVLVIAAAGGGWWAIQQDGVPDPAKPEGASADQVEEREAPALVEESAPSLAPESAPPVAVASRESDAKPAQGEAIGPARFLAGSTEQEIEDALALCRAHVDRCEREWYASEKARAVDVPRMTVDPTEVTNAAFAEFVAASGHETDAERRGSSYHGPIPVAGLSWRQPSKGGPAASERPDHPVVHVSQSDAAAYCASLGGRLPSEEEWEFAARGEGRRVFPWGDAWDPSRPLWRGPDAPELAPVGSHPAGDTPEGRKDFAGSVWEWTASVDDEGRILKGGSWREWNPANLRASARMILPADETTSDIGFRCVRDVRE